MNHLMIDFETLDTTPTAVVLSLGGVFFNKNNIISTFYCEFDVESQMRNRRTISADTIMWWLNQTTGRKFTPDKGKTFDVSLNEFLAWLQKCKMDNLGFDNVWANDPDFDCAILENLINSLHGPNVIPYPFWQKRSMRTFIEYVGKGKKVQRTQVQQHNALVDAIDQARYVMELLP
jgi:hypothetical protein